MVGVAGSGEHSVTGLIWPTHAGHLLYHWLCWQPVALGPKQPVVHVQLVADAASGHVGRVLAGEWVVELEQVVHVHHVAGVIGELVVCVLAEEGQGLVVSELQNYGQVVCVQSAVVHTDG